MQHLVQARTRSYVILASLALGNLSLGHLLVEYTLEATAARSRTGGLCASCNGPRLWRPNEPGVTVRPLSREVLLGTGGTAMRSRALKCTPSPTIDY